MRIGAKIYTDNALKWFKAGKDLADLARFSVGAEAIYYSGKTALQCSECGENELVVDPYDDSEVNAIAWDCLNCTHTMYVGL